MPSIQEELHSISQILHLAHHRNKNQHRLAKWWKAFSMLRRHISKLIFELDINIQYAALSARAKKTTESREIVERRVAFLEDVLMEKFYLAFSQLVADNQYAALGLMLVGTLARVRKLIQPLRREGEIAEERDAGKILEVPDEKRVYDFGEVVRREEFRDVEEDREQRPGDENEEDATAFQKPKTKKRPVALDETKGSSVNDSMIVKRPKKKRKKGDAFDDLFAGLV